MQKNHLFQYKTFFRYRHLNLTQERKTLNHIFVTGLADSSKLLFTLYAKKSTAKQVGGYASSTAASKWVKSSSRLFSSD